jgi:CubicO group peptidase (beta-lactamase class C family)
VQHVLDMQASVVFSEDYDDPTSEVQTQDRVGAWRSLRPGDPPGIHAFLAGIRGAGPHGRVFQYCSGTTDLLGWVLERATGRRYWDLLSDELWAKLGPEHDGLISVDRCDAPFPNGGISVTARDLARFGQMMLQDGNYGGEQIVPAAWVADTRHNGSNDAFVQPDNWFAGIYPRGSYRNKWWITGNEHGDFFGSGIYGQHLYIDPTARVVIAKFSSRPHALDEEKFALTRAGFAAIIESLEESH